MRMHIPVAVVAIVLGALETSAGAQELVYVGILRSRTYPLVAGTLGTVAGALLLAAGVCLLLRWSAVRALVGAAAYVAVPVFILIGVITHIAGWPVTVARMAVPLFLFVFARKSKAAASIPPLPQTGSI